MGKIKTKQKILDKALELFNSNGVMNVSQRDIANDLGISQGNLTYHFEKREDIILALYNQMVKQNEMDLVTEPSATKKDLLNYSKRLMTNYYQYRFIFINLVDIFSHYPAIKKHFLDISVVREQEFLNWIQLLVKNNVLDGAKLAQKEGFFIDLQVFIVGWLGHMVCFEKKINDNMINKYYNILIENKISPYLVEEK